MNPAADVRATGTAFGNDQDGQFHELTYSALTFEHEGRPGRVRLEGFRVTSISFSRSARSAAEVDAIVAELEQQYGPPTFFSQPTQPNAMRAGWNNETTSLVVNTYRNGPDDWSVSITYERLVGRAPIP